MYQLFFFVNRVGLRQTLSGFIAWISNCSKVSGAHRSETNFLDVVPQAKRLRLSLNMPFSEVIDPRGICKNVAEVGRWGNGEVEISFSEIDELPYIMNLVKQSFDRQTITNDYIN